MADNSTLIAVSAFSGLAGALLTQALTGMFGYYSDKRKANIDLKNQVRNKMAEVAETFYYITGETMAVLKKNIEYWKDRNKPRSEASIEFLTDEMRKLDVYMDKLNAENWKHNLIGLYFNISLSYNELITANTKSHLLYIKLLDIADKIRAANNNEKEKLYGEYHICIFDLCAQYETIYNMLENDMGKVKSELLNSYKVN